MVSPSVVIQTIDDLTLMRERGACVRFEQTEGVKPLLMYWCGMPSSQEARLPSMTSYGERERIGVSAVSPDPPLMMDRGT